MFQKNCHDKYFEEEISVGRFVKEFLFLLAVMSMGYKDKEARLGLRASRGSVQGAINHIENKRAVSIFFKCQLFIFCCVYYQIINVNVSFLLDNKIMAKWIYWNPTNENFHHFTHYSAWLFYKSIWTYMFFVQCHYCDSVTLYSSSWRQYSSNLICSRISTRP